MIDERRYCTACGREMISWIRVCDCETQPPQFREADALRAENDQLRARIAQLEAERRWIPVAERLPCKPGAISARLWVRCKEFGQSAVYSVARCFLSAATDAPAWYLDEEFYHLDCPHYIAEHVTHWMLLPEPPDDNG